MNLFLDLVIVIEYRVGRQAIAAICPKNNRRMGAQFMESGAETRPGDPLVFGPPQVPVLPLHAAHPAEHDRDTFSIGSLNHGFISDLEFPSNEVQSEILDVADHGSIAFGIVLEKEIRGVGRAANEVIAAVDLQIKIASAAANVRKAVVLIAGLGDLANAKIDFLGVGSLALGNEIYLQVIEVRLAPAVRPPQLRVWNRELSHVGRRNCDFAILRRPQSNFLLESDWRLPCS